MKTKIAARTMMFILTASLGAAAPLMAQGPSCYISPGLEKTFVSVRQLDQDSNRWMRSAADGRPRRAAGRQQPDGQNRHPNTSKPHRIKATRQTLKTVPAKGDHGSMTRFYGSSALCWLV